MQIVISATILFSAIWAVNIEAFYPKTHALFKKISISQACSLFGRAARLKSYQFVGENFYTANIAKGIIDLLYLNDKNVLIYIGSKRVVSK